MRCLLISWALFDVAAESSPLDLVFVLSALSVSAAVPTLKLTSLILFVTPPVVLPLFLLGRQRASGVWVGSVACGLTPGMAALVRGSCGWGPLPMPS